MSDHEKTLNPLQTAIAISKKLNNFKTIQAMTAKLERIFRNYLGTLFLKSSWHVRQYCSCHGNQVLAIMFFKICFFPIELLYVILKLAFFLI